MRIKKTVCILLTVALIFTTFLTTTVSAAGNFTAPDLIVSDVRLSKDDYEVGDIIIAYMDVTNVGGLGMPLGWGALTLTGMYSIENEGGWVGHASRPYIFPGQTITMTFNHLRVDSETITIEGRCNSNSNYAETGANMGNNAKNFTFTSTKSGVDLKITEIKPTILDFSEGAAVAFDITYKNIGTKGSAYNNLGIELKANGQTITTHEITDLDPHEVHKVRTEPVFIQSDKLNVSAYINYDEGIADESNHGNNEYATSFNAIKSKQDEYYWMNGRIGGGGYVRTEYVDPYTKDSIYFMADVCGPYKYNPYTGMQEPLLDKTLNQRYNNLKSSKGFAVAADNPDILFFSGGAGQQGTMEGDRPTAILRSFDAGKTWQIFDVPFEYHTENNDYTNGCLALDPNNSNILFSVSAKRGLWRSDTALSGDLNFKNIPLPGYKYEVNCSGLLTNVLIDPSVVKNGRSQNIYVSAAKYGIFKSTDGGNTFEIMPGGPTEIVRNMWLDPRGRLICGGPCGIKRYSNGKWEDISPLPGKDYRIHFNPNNPDMIACSYEGNILLSTDDGANWKNILQNATVDEPVGGQWNTSFKSQIGNVRFDPFRNNTLYYGTWWGCYKINDVTAKNIVVNDITWGNEELTVRSLMPTPEGAAVPLVVGVGDCNCRLVYNIFNWEEECAEPQATRNTSRWMQETVASTVCENNPNFMARVGGSAGGWETGNGLYSQDGGKTWIEFESYPRTQESVARDQNGDVTMASGVNEDGVPTILINTLIWDAERSPGRVWRSVDLGKTWERVESLPINTIKRWLDTNEPCAADKVNKDIFYFYDADTGNFYTSYDNGLTFTVVNDSLPTCDQDHTVYTLSGLEGSVIVSANGMGLWYSSDYGKNFTRLPHVDSCRFSDVGKKAPCSDVDSLYVYGVVDGNEGIYRSIDLGQNWVKINNENQHTLWNTVNCFKADKRKFGIVYIGTQGQGVTVGYPSKLDLVYPKVGIYESPDGKTVGVQNYTIKGGVTKESTLDVILNGKKYDAPLDENLMYSVTLPLKEGENILKITATDAAGHESMPCEAVFNYMPGYLGLTMTETKAVTTQGTYEIKGNVDTSAVGAKVYINDESVAVNKITGSFSKTVALENGINDFDIKAEVGGKEQHVDFVVDQDHILPTMQFVNLPKETNDPLLNATFILSEPAKVEVNGIGYTVDDKDNLEMTIPVPLENGTNNIKYTLTDLAGNVNVVEARVNFIGDAEFNKVEKTEAIAYSGTPVVDGEIDDAYVLNRVISRPCNTSPRNAAKFGLLADDNYLYLLIRVYDENVAAPELTSANSYNCDSVEVYIDPEMDRAGIYGPLDQQLRIGIGDNCLPFSAQTKGALKSSFSKSKILDDGYIIETAFSWDDLLLGGKPAGAIGFDISINDSSTGNSRDGVIVWSGEDNNYNNTSKFGTLYFGGK